MTDSTALAAIRTLVLPHFPVEADAPVAPLGHGLINETFVLDAPAPGLPQRRYVLQRVNPLFSPAIHQNIQAVTKADVLRVAQRFLSTDKMAIVVVGDRASQETPLRKLAPLEVRDLDGAPVAATPTSRDVGPRPGASSPGPDQK